MHLVDLSKIKIGPRQRTEMGKKELLELRDSILNNGLLHPITVRPLPDGSYELVAGERRLNAIRLIYEEGKYFLCNAHPITNPEIPAIYLGDMDPQDFFIIEFEENVIRVELPWQDRMRALARIADINKVEHNMSAQATAQAIASKAPNLAAGTIANKISQAKIISSQLHRPAVAGARNENEAVQIILRQQHAKYQAEVLRRASEKAGAQREKIEHRIIHGDLHTELPKMPESHFDLILTDPPYGLGANSQAGYKERSAHIHDYDDTPENARRILAAILKEGWRISRPKASLVVFSHHDHWSYFKQQAQMMGWAVFPFPLIWQKSESEGLTPWKGDGFTHIYETLFYAVKGQKALTKQALDVISGYRRVSKSLRIHAAEKPIDLLRYMIELTTMPGDRILDPCCGSGSAIQAAKELDRYGIGIELSKEVADEAMVRVASSFATNGNSNSSLDDL